MRFFVVSAGQPGEDYMDENFGRIIQNNAFNLHEDTKMKGFYAEIKANDVLILKYNDNLVAYGIATKRYETTKEPFNLWAGVVEWALYNIEDPKQGISKTGIGKAAMKAGSFDTVKEVNSDYAIEKITLINTVHPDYNYILENQNKTIQEMEVQEYIKLIKYKKQIILQGPPGTGKTYTAKEVAFQLITGTTLSRETKMRKQQLEHQDFKECCELIQFHPAYSYEDFVRGIVAETQGDKVNYITKNKILARIAKKAKDNLDKSAKSISDLKEDERYQMALEGLIDKVQSKIDDSDSGKYHMTDSGFIFESDDEYFKYTGESWQSSFRIPYGELLIIAKNNLRSRQQIKKSRDVRGSSRQHATYLWKIMEEYYKLLDGFPIPTEVTRQKAQNYVLIIDEINRANLPAVLGELIYALEYRNQPVNTLYPINENDYSITLPENLYIIGTMNTADRSVGHIDYAIRRRFAFINVLPNDIQVPDFAKDTFAKVSDLFSKDTLASDFKKDDVQIGHSYFMAKTKEELAVKIKYEVIPILKEYVKDGVLNEKAESLIKQLAGE
jgi:Cdc6-like AAA superfamily ATPase